MLPGDEGGLPCVIYREELSDMARTRDGRLWSLVHAELDGPGVLALRSRLQAQLG
jgi:hypothetical protein